MNIQIARMWLTFKKDLEFGVDLAQLHNAEHPRLVLPFFCKEQFRSTIKDMVEAGALVDDEGAVLIDQIEQAGLPEEIPEIMKPMLVALLFKHGAGAITYMCAPRAQVAVPSGFPEVQGRSADKPN